MSATWDHPGRPSPNSPKSSEHRRQWAQRGSAERDTAGGPREPNLECSEKGFRRPRTCPRSPLAVQQIAGPWSSRRGAAHGCEVGRVYRQSAQDPAGSAGAARSRSATPLPSVTRRLPQDGRAPGADPVHVGRRARSRPASLLRFARSTWSAAARPRGRRRPAAAGIGSERGSDAGPGRGQQNALPQRRRQRWGVGGGCGRGAPGAGVGGGPGRGAAGGRPVTPA